MSEISINSLADLVVAQVESPDQHIDKMFDWYFSRELEIVRWVLGLAATIGAAFIVAVFKSQILVSWWQAFLLVVIPGLIAMYGWIRLQRVRAIQREYVLALKVYRELLLLRPFLISYRKAKTK